MVGAMPDPIEWRELTPRVFLTTLQPAGVNVGLVVGDEAALLVDAGPSPEAGARVLAAANAFAPVPVTHVVVTHNHWDHWFGIAGMTGVESIAHENLTDTAACADTLAQAAAQGLDPLPVPTATFSMARVVSLGEVRVEILHFGGGHTASDAFVLVAGQNVVFTGDMLEEGADPQFDETTVFADWPKALDGVLGTANDDTVFVPGHGAVVDRMFAFVQRAQVGFIHGTAEHLIGRGVRLEDAAGAAEWPFRPETMATALPLVYAELAAKGVRPRTQLPITGI